MCGRKIGLDSPELRQDQLMSIQKIILIDLTIVIRLTIEVWISVVISSRWGHLCRIVKIAFFIHEIYGIGMPVEQFDPAFSNRL